MSDQPVTAATAALDLDHIDYSALTDPVTKQQVAAYRAEYKAAARGNPNFPTSSFTLTSIVVVTGIALFACIFASGLGFAIVNAVTGQSTGGTISVGGTVLVFGCLIVAILVFRGIWGDRRNWEKWMRMSRFASDNGLRFDNTRTPTIYPGSVFTIGDNRGAYEHFTSASGRYLDFGSYRYVTGSGKSRSAHTWGYLAIQLDRNLPNMVLDSKANNGLFGSTDLPTTFRRDQMLSLEGDFDKYFTLYCPNEYQADALYVFTPDLMALLIDDAAPFDVEIVDNWMFLYSTHVFPPLDVATYQRLFRIISTVGSKAISQSEHYRDDRLISPSDDIVAPEGQRLRHGASAGTIVILALLAGVWFASHIADWIH